MPAQKLRLVRKTAPGLSALTCNYLCSNIMSHLDEYKLLSDRQHACRKYHSCETQLATVIDDWANISG